ncbi:MAG: amidase family protein [Bryobacteraceae bacterium]
MASPDQDVFFCTIKQLNRRLLAKEFSAEELARAFALRLQQLGPRYNALALPLVQESIRQAKTVDADLKRGRLRGPLQGVPYAVKDLLSYAGQPTTWGAKPYAGQVFDFNATVVDKLAGVGAILAGKLSMVELAGGGGYRRAGRAGPPAVRRRPWRRDWCRSLSARKPPAPSSLPLLSAASPPSGPPTAW